MFDRKGDNIPVHFLNISYYRVLDSVPEIISEWWSSTGKDINTFLKDEHLSEILDEQMFINIITGKYNLDIKFLLLIKEKIPCDMQIEKLYRLNQKFCKLHREVEDLPIKGEALVALLKQLYIEKKEQRAESIKLWHSNHKERAAEASARYRRLHHDKVIEYKRKYRETHKEQIKAYKASRREITNEQQRQRYRKDIEKSRALGRAHQKKYASEHKEEILLRNKRYREENREEIRERVRKRMEDSQYRAKVQEQRRKSYKKLSKETQQRRTQKRLQNIDQALIKEHEYGKVYRAKHREEINARSRERYAENQPVARKKNAERKKLYRHKQRFKNETSKIIFPLLDALILHKSSCKQQ